MKKIIMENQETLNLNETLNVEHILIKASSDRSRVQNHRLEDRELFFDRTTGYLYIGDGKKSISGLQPINASTPNTVRSYRTNDAVTRNVTGDTCVYTIPVGPVQDLKGTNNNYYTDYSFELYLENVVHGWEIFPGGTSIVLDFGSGQCSKQKTLYMFGRDAQAPSMSFQSGAVTKIYVPGGNSESSKRIYIEPAVSLWA